MTTREVTYSADDMTMAGHLARPAGQSPWPCVLIGHDGVGLNDFQRGLADQLADRGYLALAMDYHGGQWFSDPDAMLARVLPLIADVPRMRAIGRAALEVLLAEPGADPDRLAGLGYGAGGSIMLALASDGVPFRAVAAVHPAMPPARAEDWTEATGTFLICTGSEDPLCTPEQVLTFCRALQDAGLDWRINIYGGAQHAFWHPPVHDDGSLTNGTTQLQATLPGVGHHPTHASRAWPAVLDLMDESARVTTTTA